MSEYIWHGIRQTTLDKQFTTKGEVRELGMLDRTHHEKRHFISKGNYQRTYKKAHQI